MKTVNQLIRKHLLDTMGFTELLPDLPEIKRTQWSKKFEMLMCNRLVQGAFRYGLIQQDSFADYNYTESIVTRINKFEKDHNLEHLVDAANLCMMAFLKAEAQGHKLKSIDDGEHTKKELI